MMNEKMTESMLKRIQAEHERRIQRIAESKHSHYDSDFKLVGTLNMFEILPDFVIPIFINTQEEIEDPNIMNKSFYIQVGSDEKDTIQYFTKLENYGSMLKQKVSIIKGNNIYSGRTYDIKSRPVYAFQYTETDVFWGNYMEMKEFFKKYLTEDENLQEQIQDFLNLESKHIWKRLKKELEIYFPTASESEIHKKIRTLMNNDFKGKELELYIPKFYDIVLRVGVRVKGETKKAYFATKEGEQLDELLEN